MFWLFLLMGQVLEGEVNHCKAAKQSSFVVLAYKGIVWPKLKFYPFPSPPDVDGDCGT